MANKNEEKMDQLLNAMDVLIKAVGANWVRVPEEPTPKKTRVKAVEKLNKVIETKPLVVKQPAKKLAKPAKKRGRPKAAPKVTPEEQEEIGEAHIHSIKPQRAGTRKRGDRGPNIFDPSEFDTSADEKSAEYKKLKDGGIVRAEARQSHSEVFCTDCKQKVCVIKELARVPYFCGDFRSPDGCRNAK